MMILNVILVSYNFFLGHNINMVHSCIAMLKVKTMLSKLSGKILILIKKIIKIFFLLNYFKIILLEWPLTKLEVTPLSTS